MTPMQTFIDTLPVAREKLMQAADTDSFVLSDSPPPLTKPVRSSLNFYTIEAPFRARTATLSLMPPLRIIHSLGIPHRSFFSACAGCLASPLLFARRT